MAFKLLARNTWPFTNGRHGANQMNISGGDSKIRLINSGQVFTALKPFFLYVHPDFFSQFPKERACNENSLKELNSYIESGKSNRSTGYLTFYLRDQQQNQNNLSNTQLPHVTPSIANNNNNSQSNNTGDPSRFQAIRIDLGQKDVRRTVHSILQKCNLSTTYIDSLPSQPSESQKKEFSDVHQRYQAEYWHNYRDPNVEDAERDLSQKKAVPNDLQTWLDKNVVDAKSKLEECWPIREEIIRLRENLASLLGLSDLPELDCGWSTRHMRGCLESFLSLVHQHPEVMTVLKGRRLIFGRETGVSLDGCVILNSGEVRTNWLDLISNVKNYDALILRIPSVQNALSRALRDINVVHRKFGPKRLAETYETLLRKLITSIGDYHRKSSFPKAWPEKLDHLELVVESDAGPLMVSPTGQIICPSSCPPFLLINFITSHMEEASSKLEQYKKQKYEEKDLHEKCIQKLNLVALQKDDNVTPNLMIECCKRLLADEDLIRTLHGTHLWITTYYSVLSDGELCIPWNWKGVKT